MWKNKIDLRITITLEFKMIKDIKLYLRTLKYMFCSLKRKIIVSDIQWL